MNPKTNKTSLCRQLQPQADDAKYVIIWPVSSHRTIAVWAVIAGTDLICFAFCVWVLIAVCPVSGSRLLRSCEGSYGSGDNTEQSRE